MTENVIAGSGDGKIAAINLADVEIQVSELSLEHYQLTKIRGTGTLFVSAGAEPKIRIIDEAVIMAKREFVIGGQGHKTVALT